MKNISPEELTVLAKYIYDISGIHLDESKGYLLETRLKPLLSSYHCNSYSEIYYKAKADLSGEIRERIIDAISTNETLFFRDQKPFQLLENKIIPDLIDRRSKQKAGGKIPIRIWSAACSFGQEVYSTIITLMEMLPNIRNYDISILGTDIADEAIARASYGKYNKFEIDRGLPRQYLNRYFNQAGDSWRIKDEVRVMANYKKLNLMEPFTGLGPFDIVFCRNVAIYFSREDKIKLYGKIARVLAPDGYLILGGSENLNGIPSDFVSRTYVKAMFYQLKGADQLAGQVSAPAVAPVYTAPAPVARPVIPRPQPVAPVQPLMAQTPPAAPKPVAPAPVIPAAAKPAVAPAPQISIQKPIITAEAPAPVIVQDTYVPPPPPPPRPPKTYSSIYSRNSSTSSSLLSNLQGRTASGTPVSFGQSASAGGSLLQKIQQRKSK